MKTPIRLFALLLLLTAGACQRHTIIPDDQLALIFRDAFLVNAHLNHEAKRDSLKVYEPIFARYGYTTADVQYTIGNFSKRKSARLGDVVEAAIVLLEKEGKVYEREVEILDTIDRTAERLMTRTVRSDSLLRVRTLKETARLRIALPAEAGSYTLEFDYRVDSLDRNDRLRGEWWFERADGSRSTIATTQLRKQSDEHYTRTFRADTTHRTLHIDIGLVEGKWKQPALTVRNLTLTHQLNTAEAVERMADRQFNVRIFADEFFGALQPDGADAAVASSTAGVSADSPDEKPAETPAE